MKVVFAFPMDRMILNNNHMFPTKLSDGLTTLNLVVADLKELGWIEN